MTYPTTASVLENVIALIAKLEATDDKSRRKVRTYEYMHRLSIFDWWKDWLTLSDLKSMKAFLTKAIKYGYNGYACFKVGASGCANGMWAYKEESTSGYSPDGEFLYRSFTPSYTAWDAKLADGTYVGERLRAKGIAYDDQTFKLIEQYIA